MKATYEKEYIQLSNGVRFLRREGEADNAFIQRVKTQIESDYCQTLELEGVKESFQSSAPIAITEQPPEVLQEPYHNKGKYCTFERRLTGEVVSGRIIYVYLDKRKNLLYYRVKTSTGIVITRTNNKSLKII